MCIRTLCLWQGCLTPLCGARATPCGWRGVVRCGAAQRGAVKMWMRRFPRGDTLYALGSCLMAVDHSLVYRQYAHRQYV